MVYKWELQIPKLMPELKRRAYLYLPACYDEQPDARFPVMYMFDGHNVFFDEDATYGKSWGIGWRNTARSPVKTRNSAASAGAGARR